MVIYFSSTLEQTILNVIIVGKCKIVSNGETSYISVPRNLVCEDKESKNNRKSSVSLNENRTFERLGVAFQWQKKKASNQHYR
jgi:hypothetical protein